MIHRLCTDHLILASIRWQDRQWNRRTRRQSGADCNHLLLFNFYFLLFFRPSAASLG